MIKRRAEIGVLRAVGYTKDEVVRILLAEAAFLGAIGAGVGTAIAVATTLAATAIFLGDPSALSETAVLYPAGAAIVTASALPRRYSNYYPCRDRRPRMAITTGDTATIDYTGRLDDGRIFDTSRETVAEEAGLTDAQADREFEPLTVETGAGQIIDGLEEALVGMEAGDEDTVTIPPEKGYGEPTDDRIREYDAEEFERMTGGETPAEGAFVESPQGGMGEIVHAGSETVRVDFNHQLAGETLEFEIEVLDVN